MTVEIKYLFKWALLTKFKLTSLNPSLNFGSLTSQARLAFYPALLQLWLILFSQFILRNEILCIIVPSTGPSTDQRPLECCAKHKRLIKWQRALQVPRLVKTFSEGHGIVLEVVGSTHVAFSWKLAIHSVAELKRVEGAPAQLNIKEL